MDLEELDLNPGSQSNNDSNSSENDVDLTAAEVIEMMEEAWINEKFAPEILPNKTELVDCLLGQISHMNENLENLSNNDFHKGIHQMELDRLRYIISSYLRVRLEKIETFIFNIIEQEQERATIDLPLYLSDSELEFAKSYKDSIQEHFQEVMKFWPGNVSDLWKDERVAPNLNSFIFLKSKTQVEGVIIDEANEDEDNDLVDLNDGSQMIISYKSVHNLLKSGNIKLI